MGLYLPSNLLVSGASGLDNDTKDINQRLVAREWMRHKYEIQAVSDALDHKTKTSSGMASSQKLDLKTMRPTQPYI